MQEPEVKGQVLVRGAADGGHGTCALCRFLHSSVPYCSRESCVGIFCVMQATSTSSQQRATTCSFVTIEEEESQVMESNSGDDEIAPDVVRALSLRIYTTPSFIALTARFSSRAESLAHTAAEYR